MLRRSLHLFGYLVFLLSAVEALLWLAAGLSPDIALRLSNRYGLPPYLEDPVLGLRPNPRYGDHDRRGFRNRGEPGRGAIVALGDSQTYGINAPRELAWPQQLSELLGVEVYNMACGTWAPPHYHYLLDEVLSLEPQLVLTAFYAGNDLWDSIVFVQRNAGKSGIEGDRQLPPGVAASVERRTSEIARLSSEAARLLKPGFSNRPGSEAADLAGPQAMPSLWAVVRDNSKSYGALRILRAQLRKLRGGRSSPDWPPAVDEAHWIELHEVAATDPGLVLFARPPVRTVLNPGYRMHGVAVLEDPLLQHGLRIALEDLTRIDKAVRSSGARHLVVLLPSKERVYNELLQSNQRSSVMDRLGANESSIWQQTTARLAEAEVDFVDTLPALVGAAAEGTHVYPYSSESHPSPEGYRVIAEAVAEAIRQRRLDG